MIVAMHASRSRPTVSSRRCCCVLAMSDADFRGTHAPVPLTGPQVPAGLGGEAVAVPEAPLAEDHRAAHTGGDHGMVVAIDHPPQAAVERHLLFVVAIHRVVEAGRV